jgi:hypothetical protein
MSTNYPDYPSTEPERTGFYSDLYGGLLPDPLTLYTMEKNSYVSPQEAQKMAPVNGYSVVLKTPTITIYRDNYFDAFVVAIRGTADWTDFKAWFPTATNSITNTDRWERDYDILSNFQKAYPPDKYIYYGVGHSLGGEIMDQFINKGMIQKGRSYNPAIQLGDIRDADLAKKNARIYASADPLYNLEGRLNHPTEVRPSPPSGIFFNPLTRIREQHSIQNPVFAGGATGGSLPLDEALYARVKAEADKKYKKHSAYKSGWIVKRYKELGGKYKGKPAGLKRWFKEEWKDVGSKEGDYPLYRPTKRVSKDTPKTADEVGELRLLVQDKLKQKIKGSKNLPKF